MCKWEFVNKQCILRLHLVKMKQLGWVCTLTDNFTALWSPKHCTPRVHINPRRSINAKKESSSKRGAGMLKHIEGQSYNLPCRTSQMFTNILGWSSLNLHCRLLMLVIYDYFSPNYGINDFNHLEILSSSFPEDSDIWNNCPVEPPCSQFKNTCVK